MRNFLTLVFALVLTMSAFADIGLVNRSNEIQYDGTVNSNTLDSKFINVINSSGATIASGSAVVLDATVDDGASVTVSATAGLSPLCIMVASCSSAKLCKCQTKGKNDFVLFDYSAVGSTAGKRFYLSSANAGYIAARITENASEAPGGVFYDADVASGGVQVYIDL